MNCEQAQAYFVNLWRAALDAPARAELERHLAECGACRTECEKGRRTWEALGELRAEEPSERLRVRFYAELHEAERRQRRRERMHGWMGNPWVSSAAAVVLVVAGIGVGRMTAARDDSKVADLQHEVADMRQLMALSLLEQQSASERLRGVSYASAVQEPDSDVRDALLRTLDSDPNVNVRLATVDALHRFAGSPEVRHGLARALAREQSPLVQIAILDELVELRERSAVSSVDRLLREPQLNPDVRQRAEWAVRRLQ
jgi:hypothetical protein